jgi:hypothetical protein
MARVLIPLAEGPEELEAATVIDLLRRARDRGRKGGSGGRVRMRKSKDCAGAGDLMPPSC